MQNLDETTARDNQGARSSENRRKRINRLKTAIIIIAFLLLILPTIFCIYLGVKVDRLQQQMKVLMDLHSEYGLSYDYPDNENLAYAAEKPADFTKPDKVLQETIPGLPSDSVKEEDAGLSGGSGRDNSKAADTATNTDTDDITDIDAANSGDSDIDNDTDNSTADSTDKNGADADIDTQNNADSASGKPNQDSGKGPDSGDGKASDQDKGIYDGKTVYLTFDDGPSIYTDDILDILAEYNIKATFFVVGKTDTNSKNMYQRIVNEGHTLGMHSYSHKYQIIYNSVEDFDKDFTKLWKLLYDTTGYKPSIYRFPGGSDNLVNKHGMDDFIRYLNKKSIVYFDWNVVSGDATGVDYTVEQLIDNVLQGVAKKKTAIVLMHDSPTKEKTVESLPGLIEKLISGGAEILPLDNTVTPIQMIKADSIN